jgi:predicted dehydrogenase
MRILIIGLGSIANKHIQSILKINGEAEIFALRHDKKSKSIDNVHNIYSLDDAPKNLDFILISNPSSKHYNTIQSVLHFKCPLFIEKPVFTDLKGANQLIEKINKQNILTYVGCNLRFHPIIEYLKSEFTKRKPIEFNVYCGSFLPDWRANSDYREGYSAKKELGGGVHFDLIHELDYSLYLLGDPSKVDNYFAKKSSLEISSIDIAHYVLEYPDTSTFITLNYYRPEPKRLIEIVWTDTIWFANLLTGEIKDENNKLIFSDNTKIANTYDEQMKYFLNCIKNSIQPENDIESGVKTLKVCLNE